MKPTPLALVIGALCSCEPLYAKEFRPDQQDILLPSSSLIQHPSDDPLNDNLLDDPHQDSMMHSFGHATASSIKMFGKFIARSTWYDDFNPAANRSPLLSQLADSKRHLFWYYRLQNAVIAGIPEDQELIDPGLDDNPPVGPPPPVLPQPKAQIAAYAALPNALFSVEENLQAQFIHDTQLAGRDGRPNLFISGYHVKERYHSLSGRNNSESRYQGWLLGSRGLLLGDEQQHLALSLAINKGHLTTVPTPHYGISSGQFDIQGINAMLSLQQSHGLQLAIPLGMTQYRGSISTHERGKVAQVKARGGNVGIDGGWRWQRGTHAFTPVAGVTAQWLQIPDVHDKDDLRLSYRHQTQLKFSGGLKYDFSPMDAMTFGLEARYVQHSDYSGKVNVDKQGEFSTGSSRQSMQLSGYIGWQITDDIQLNGQIKSHQRLRQEGASNWQTQLGIQVAF
jgi:hypothetical protein